MTEQKIAPVLSDDRAEFEAWCKPRGYRVLRSYPDADRYQHPETDVAWETWQAVLAKQGAVREQCTVRDVGFQVVEGKHVPTVLVQFAIDDWDARDRFAAAIRALKGTPAAACIGCGGPGWYTSHTTGYGHWVPCRHCNPGGKPVSQPSTNPGPLAAVERDAERYRWLKECNSGPIGIVAWHRDEEKEMVLVESMADEAIDAAIAASKEGAKS